jgi:hypothetical protein
MVRAAAIASSPIGSFRVRSAWRPAAWAAARHGDGAHYRHTTPEMAARIATAIVQRLTVVLEVAEQALEAHPNRSPLRVS